MQKIVRIARLLQDKWAFITRAETGGTIALANSKQLNRLYFIAVVQCDLIE